MVRTRQQSATQAATGGLGFRPLYGQVRDALVRRLIDGVWQPGQPLPSEMQLAAELGVSQGTVRKALDSMAADNLVVRRQGRGTFVAKHDEERILFQFFKLVPDERPRTYPESRVLSMQTSPANEMERAKLQLESRSRVVRIHRVRSLDGQAVVYEAIALPHARFPDLAHAELPNNLYGLYAMRYGIAVGSTREQLKAVAAGAAEAEALAVEVGEPVLRIDRVALSLEQVPVEWRVSFCLTRDVHYQSFLR